jgi:hypothetical protein
MKEINKQEHTKHTSNMKTHTDTRWLMHKSSKLSPRAVLVDEGMPNPRTVTWNRWADAINIDHGAAFIIGGL